MTVDKQSLVDVHRELSNAHEAILALLFESRDPSTWSKLRSHEADQRWRDAPQEISSGAIIAKAGGKYQIQATTTQGLRTLIP